MKSKLLIAAAVLTLAGGMAATVDVAEAQRRGRTVEGTVTGARGQQGQVRRETSRGEGLRKARTEATGPNGRTRTAETERKIDREAGTAKRDRVVTGPNGGQRTVSDSVQRGEDGAFTFDRTATGRNGATREVSGQGQVTQLENGRSTAGTFTGPNGEGSFSRSNTVDENGLRTIQADRQNAAGGTSSATTTIDRGTGVVNRTATQTNAAGQTRSVEIDKVRTDAGFDVTRTVTPAQGDPRTQTGTFTVTPNTPAPPAEEPGEE